MKLYTNKKSRGRIVEWYIRELGLTDAEFINLDMEHKEHKAEQYLTVHPFGRVPALVDGDLTLTESGAILLYLGEKHGGLDTPEKRATAAQWVMFANTTLSDAAFAAQYRDKWMPEVLGRLDKMLAERDFIQGNEFSVADVAVGSNLWWLPTMVPEFQLTPYTHIKAYMDRLEARPGWSGGAEEPA